MDEQVEFALAEHVPGANVESNKTEMSDIDRKRMTIQETRKSLPIYPYREQLLEAIAEHQVKIII